MKELVERWKSRAEKLYADADALGQGGRREEAQMLKARALMILSMTVELVVFLKRKNEQS